VARQAVLDGASLINDISAGEMDAQMFTTVGELKVPYIAMHMKGTPQTMQTQTSYPDLIKEITTYFHTKINLLQQLGIKDILIDPGIGFSKTIDQNFELLNHLTYLKILGRPLLIGVSRKSLIWKTLNGKPEDALNGTTALHMSALINGASILRVHDVKEAVETIRLFNKLHQSSSSRATPVT
jgi:dihydropteroate synthase